MLCKYYESANKYRTNNNYNKEHGHDDVEF